MLVYGRVVLHKMIFPWSCNDPCCGCLFWEVSRFPGVPNLVSAGYTSPNFHNLTSSIARHILTCMYIRTYSYIAHMYIYIYMYICMYSYYTCNIDSVLHNHKHVYRVAAWMLETFSRIKRKGWIIPLRRHRYLREKHIQNWCLCLYLCVCIQIDVYVYKYIILYIYIYI